MKVGDVVRNVMPVRNNPVVNESRGWKPIESGHLGIVVDVRQTEWNKTYSKSGKGDVYVDVMMSVDGASVRCGNYHSGTFEVVV